MEGLDGGEVGGVDETRVEKGEGLRKGGFGTGG